NVALSITLTAVSTLLAPFFTPLLMKLLAGQLIEIEIMKMMRDIVIMVIFPTGAGLLVNKLLRGRAQYIHKVMPVVCMAVIGIVLVLLTATGRESLLEVGFFLVLLALVHNLSGFSLGYGMARLARLSEQDCRTVALEVGMQNGGLAMGLA